jgi:hypothetical protein
MTVDGDGESVHDSDPYDDKGPLGRGSVSNRVVGDLKSFTAGDYVADCRGVRWIVLPEGREALAG